MVVENDWLVSLTSTLKAFLIYLYFAAFTTVLSQKIFNAAREEKDD